MLEFYGDQEGALSVLKEYAYSNRFPSNPNAHVYLYQYLKRHCAPERKLISVLKVPPLPWRLQDQGGGGALVYLCVQCMSGKCISVFSV